MAKTRDEERAELKAGYEKGASIRTLAAETGRSYGYVHRALVESGVVLRGAEARSARPQGLVGFRHAVCPLSFRATIVATVVRCEDKAVSGTSEYWR